MTPLLIIAWATVVFTSTSEAKSELKPKSISFEVISVLILKPVKV